jgi:integrase/recombinase XerD
MISFNIELNSKPITDSNEYNLLLRITVNRKHARLALIYSVAKSHFNPKAKIGKNIRSSHPDHVKINKYIEGKVSLGKDIITNLENEGRLITAEIIKSKMTEAKSHNFFKFTDDFTAQLKATWNIGSYKKYTAVVNSIKDFCKTETLLFEEIDLTFIAEYQAFLRKEEKEQTTIAGYTSKIRSLFNKAILNGNLKFGDSPFINYKIKQGTPQKERLNEEEIIKIEKLDLVEDSLLWHVKNIFLFAFYNAGIRISDILLMKWDNIQNGRLIYNMYKTKKLHSLNLKEKPSAILDKYRNSGDSYIFPFLSDRFEYSDPLFLHNQIGAKTALINRYLKDIASKAEINKNITTHTARHSFADIARQKKINISDVSMSLGHSSIKITQAYLATLDEKAVDDTLDQMFNT